MRPPSKLASDRTETGWEHLRAGRWAEARACLEGEESPAALEGLAWAAWWLDDEAATFALRRRAHRAHRDAGDAAGAARTAIWLAVDELDFHGAASVASGWLQRARRLLEPLHDRPEHGWLAFHEGYAAHAAGDTPTARALAVRAAELGRTLDVPDLEMLGLALEGASLVACAQVSDGMRRLDEATAVALEGRAHVPISGAWTFCLLVSACIAAEDLGRAAAWCERIERFAERYGSRFMLAYCRAEYGTLHLSRGRWDEADAVLAASVEDFSRSRPAWAGGPLVALAELRRRQGRDAEAEALLERAGSGTGARLCRARMALDRGSPERAADEAERALRQIAPERRLQRAPAVELLGLACAAAGRPRRAAEALEELRATARAIGAPALAAGAARIEGALLAARAEHGAARPPLEDAVDAYERAGMPYEAALARAELARTLAALGHADAATEAARAEARLAALRVAPPRAAPRPAPHAAPGARTAAGRGPDRALAALTPREREVLALVAEGLTNRQIAERLVLSEHTVHRHVTNLLRKLGLHSRAAAAAHAARSGRTD